MKAATRSENLRPNMSKSKLPVPSSSKSGTKKHHARPAPNFDRLHQKWKDQFEMGKACTKKSNTVPQEFDVTKSGTKFKKATVTATNYDSDGESIPDIDFEGDQRALDEILSNRGISAKKTTGRATIATSSAGRMSRSKSCSSVSKNSAGKRRILGELPCDPDQKPRRGHRRSKSAKKALEFADDKQEEFGIDFEKDDTALESILTGNGIQTEITQSSKVRQTFAGSSSDCQQSITPVRSSIYYVPSKTNRMSIIDNWTAYKNRILSRVESDSNRKAQMTKIPESDKVPIESTTPINKHSEFSVPASVVSELQSNHKIMPNITASPFGTCVSIPMRNSIYASHLSYPAPKLTNTPATPKTDGQKIINKDITNTARRVLCSGFNSPAPQRQEPGKDNSSVKKQKKGVKWADVLGSPSYVDSPQRVIKKEKLSKVLFSAINEDVDDDYKENNRPIDDKQPQRSENRNQNADNRESFKNDMVLYNDDVTISNNSKENKVKDDSSSGSANAVIDKDDGTSSLSFTPISNTTLSMTHSTAAVVESLESVIPSVHSLLESATASSIWESGTPLKQHSKDFNQCFNNSTGHLNSHLDSYINNKLWSRSGSQIYMGNGKFCTSLQNSAAASENQEKKWHHGTGMSTTSTFWNKPNIIQNDNFKSNPLREQAHSNPNHAGAKIGVSSSNVTHANGNYYNEDVALSKTKEVVELHQRGIINKSEMAMHTEEAEEGKDNQDNSDKTKSKAESDGRRESVEKFVGRVKRNKKRQSIAELNGTLSESQVHFQNLQSEVSNLLENQRLGHVSEEIDNNGNENISANEASTPKSKNVNIMYQLHMIQKQQEQLMLLQRQLQEQLQNELKHEKCDTEIHEANSESMQVQQQSMMGSTGSEKIQQSMLGNTINRLDQGSANIQQGLLESMGSESVKQGILVSSESGHMDLHKKEDRLHLEECNNNGVTAVNLNNLQHSVSKPLHSIQALDLSSPAHLRDKKDVYNLSQKVDRSASTPPSKFINSPSSPKPISLISDTASISRSHSIPAFLSSAATTLSHTLTQSQNRTPSKVNRTASPETTLRSNQQMCSNLSKITTVQSNLGLLVSPKVIKFEPTIKPKIVSDRSSAVPPIWTPLALKVAADAVVKSPSDQSKQAPVEIDAGEKVNKISTETISTNENLVLDLSGSVTVTNVISSGSNVSITDDWLKFQSPVCSTQSAFTSVRPDQTNFSARNLNQSAFRNVGLSNLNQSGSLSLRANMTPIDLSPRRQKENQPPLRKIVLLVTSERYQEALLDDECALYACRLQSFNGLPESRRLINPIARMLSEGDDMHFIPIKEDNNTHHYGFREGSAFSCYSP